MGTLAAVIALLMVSGVSFYAGSVQSRGLSAQQKRELMQVQDAFGYRSAQLVNASAIPGSALGTGATASVNGNDAIGQINLNTGTNTSPGDLVHVTFTVPYAKNGTQPFVYITPIDQPPVSDWYATVDWNGFDILTSSTPNQKTNYAFAYVVSSRPWPYYITPDDPTGTVPPPTSGS